MKYIANLEQSIDLITGLNTELRVKALTIDSDEEKITVRIDRCLVSPTGVELKVLETKYYERSNHPEAPQYDKLAASPIGIGIKQLLQSDLQDYDNL